MKYEPLLIDIGDSVLFKSQQSDLSNKLSRLGEMGWVPNFMVQPHLMLLLRELPEVTNAGVKSVPEVRLTTQKSRRREMRMKENT
jgi:hypothetical protein